jgi:ribosomal protein L21E
MSKFKVGDRVRSVKDAPAEFRRAAPSYRGFEGVVNSADGFHIGFEGGACCYANVRFELVQDNKDKEMKDEEKKYKIETELSLQQVYQLRCFTGQLDNMTNLFSETVRICDKELGDSYTVIHYKGLAHKVFQGQCAEVINGKRKVVKIGDKEYYEDELQTALSNIKPINSTGE